MFNPEGLRPKRIGGNRHIRTGLNHFFDSVPRVVGRLPGQPWAGGHNPVGIGLIRSQYHLFAFEYEHLFAKHILGPMTIRPATLKEIPAAVALACDSFIKAVAPLYSDEGVRTF